MRWADARAIATPTSIETQNRRAGPLNRPCVLAGAAHHVFHYELGGTAEAWIDITRPERGQG
jgi:hypothetical protein